jgi:Mg2+ and Co2+ transporter CorA
MNVDLPHFGLGNKSMFWALIVVMLGTSIAMLMFFRRRGWM